MSSLEATDAASEAVRKGFHLAYDDALSQAWPLFAFSHLEQPAIPGAGQ